MVRLYAPWQLLAWWLAFHTQAPDVFAPAGAVAALGGALSGAFAIGGTARRARRRSRPTTYGSARWADFSDVNKVGLLRDRGVILGLYRDRYLRHDGPEHVLAVAPTRSGKGVGLVLPIRRDLSEREARRPRSAASDLRRPDRGHRQRYRPSHLAARPEGRRLSLVKPKAEASSG
jgi:hypothetical protein